MKGAREDSARINLRRIMEAVLDGDEIDWEQAARSTPSAGRTMLENLEVIFRVSRAYKQEPWSSPANWGPLEILEKIGEGAFGAVYRARERRLDRRVALKLFHPHRLSVSQLTSDVIEEGRLLARVNHPNVVTVYGAEQLEGRFGVWMELVPGKTLQEVVAERGPLEATEALLIGRDLCRALAALHAAGVVHRDIKARNVMIEESGRIVLMDLGISCEIDRGVSIRQYGTPLYAAPEMLLSCEPSCQGDIYSLGVLLYFLVSGHYPVRGSTLADIIAAHEAGDIEHLVEVRTGLPTAYLRIVEKALATNPADRFASAAEFESAIEEALATGSYTGDQEAYRRYLQGRYYWYRRYQGGIPRAIEYFRQALAMDPEFGLAHVGLADCLNQLSYYMYIRPHDGFPEAKGHLEKALTLNPNLGEAHASLGFIGMFYDWDFQASARHLRRAIDLSPQYGVGRQWYGLLLAVDGKFDEALAETRSGRELDPSSLQIAAEGSVLTLAGRYDEAVDVYRLTQETEPDAPIQNTLLGLALWYSGKKEEAVARLRTAFDLSRGEDTWAAGLLAMSLAGSGQESDARETISHLDALAGRRYVSNFHRFIAWIELGRYDRWGPLLDAAIEERDPFLVWARASKICEHWRTDPRFTEPLRQAGLLD